MPELPEVEHLRRSLEPWLVGGRLGGVKVNRRGVISVAGARRPSDLSGPLLAGATIVATHRHGKQLAIESAEGAVLVFQLGMTGSITIERERPPSGVAGRHRHVIWEFTPPALRTGQGAQRWRLVFRDPRRFGGLTGYPSLASLRAAWERLGPDALTIEGSVLARSVAASRRPTKSALLDQNLIAGVGNIYADEALFRSGIHPLRPAGSLRSPEISALAESLRSILSHAVLAGGSTLRDYRDAFGEPGDAVQSHQVYGRGGEPCMRCARTLQEAQVVGRTTVFCPRCQPL